MSNFLDILKHLDSKYSMNVNGLIINSLATWSELACLKPSVLCLDGRDGQKEVPKGQGLLWEAFPRGLMHWQNFAGPPDRIKAMLLELYRYCHWGYLSWCILLSHSKGQLIKLRGLFQEKDCREDGNASHSPCSETSVLFYPSSLPKKQGGQPDSWPVIPLSPSCVNFLLLMQQVATNWVV